MTNKIRFAAAAAILPFAFAVAGDRPDDQQTPDHPPVPMREINPRMFVVKGSDATELPPDSGSFKIDGRNIPKFKSDLYAASTIVVLFNGEATVGRECPSFNLGNGHYTYDGAEELPNLFNINVHAVHGSLKAEIDNIKEKQCVIVTDVDKCQIKFNDSGLNKLCAFKKRLFG